MKHITIAVGSILMPLAKAQASAIPNARASSLSERAQVLQRNARMQEAELLYQESFSLYPRDPVVLNNLGALARGRGSVVEAEIWYRQAVDVDPGQAVFHANVALAAMELKDFRRALTSLQNALQLGNHEMRHAMGNMLRDMGANSRALRDELVAAYTEHADTIAEPLLAEIIGSMAPVSENLPALQRPAHKGSLGRPLVQINIEAVGEMMLQKKMDLDAIVGSMVLPADQKHKPSMLNVGSPRTNSSTSLFIEDPSQHVLGSQRLNVKHMLQQRLEEVGWL